MQRLGMAYGKGKSPEHVALSPLALGLVTHAYHFAHKQFVFKFCHEP